MSGPSPGGLLPRLTLYVREGCHLCEDMAEGLGALFPPGSFALERVDIDADPHLRARYDVDVPVLVAGDVELCRHFLDPVAVSEHLAGYTSGDARDDAASGAARTLGQRSVEPPVT